MWVTSRTGSVGWVFGDLRKSSELSSCLRTERLTFEARRGQTNLCATGAARWLDVKVVSIEIFCVYLSSCRITFNSKVIKFRTWTNFVNVVYFGFPMSISHIFISGNVTVISVWDLKYRFEIWCICSRFTILVRYLQYQSEIYSVIEMIFHWFLKWLDLFYTNIVGAQPILCEVSRFHVLS